MAVTVDSSTLISGTSAGVTTTTFAGALTIGATANALVVIAGFVGAVQGTSSAFSATWNGVAMTLIGSMTAGGGSGDFAVFGLRNPATGLHDLVVNWTGANQCFAALVSFIGATTTSDAAAFKNFTTSTGATSPASVTVTNASGDMGVSGHLTDGSLTTTTDTAVAGSPANTGNISGLGATYNAAVNPALNYTFTAGTKWNSVGLSVSAGSVAAPKLKRNSSLSGLGASGPFFHDPLSRVMLGWRKSIGLWCPEPRLA